MGPIPLLEVDGSATIRTDRNTKKCSLALCYKVTGRSLSGGAHLQLPVQAGRSFGSDTGSSAVKPSAVTVPETKQRK